MNKIVKMHLIKFSLNFMLVCNTKIHPAFSFVLDFTQKIGVKLSELEHKTAVGTLNAEL